MSNQFSQEAGNSCAQNGYDDSPHPYGTYAAEQLNGHRQQQEICREMATSVRLPTNGWVTMLKRAQVEKILQLSRSAIYARMDKNSDVFDASFPTPVRYGDGKSVFWIAAEIHAWLDAQIRRTRGLSNDTRSQKPGGAA